MPFLDLDRSAVRRARRERRQSRRRKLVERLAYLGGVAARGFTGPAIPWLATIVGVVGFVLWLWSKT